MIRNEATEGLRREVEALTDPVDPAFVRGFQTSMFVGRAPEAFVAGIIADSMKLPARVWKAVLNGFWNDPVQYRPNGAPTIVIGGDKDSVFSVAEQRAVVDAIPGATFVLLPGVGHGVHWEDPYALASIFNESAARR